jgi:hypothetical protein
MADGVDLDSPREQYQRQLTALHYEGPSTGIDRELFGDVPKPSAGGPLNDTAALLYPAHIELRETVRARVEDVATVLGLSQDQQQVRNREFLAGIEEAGLNASTIGHLRVRERASAEAEEAESREEAVGR